MSTSALRTLEDPRPAAVPDTPEDFLRALGGPTLLRLRGRDRSRVRALATLVHGNEPSGIRALHAWLRSGATPAVDAVVWVANVHAALAPPGFAHRMLPGRPDLNRCFQPPFAGFEGALARSALEALRAAEPEALVDLHNNTGHNPAYGVAPRRRAAEQRLAGLFGDRLVHSELRLGALVEATAPWFPSVTVECGRAGDPAADAVALRGLRRYLGEPDLALGSPPPAGLALLVDPLRVRARIGVRVAFGDGPVDDADLTVLKDVDRHNFQRLPAGEQIAWVRDPGAWPLEAHDASGDERSRELFELRDGTLATRRELVPIMMTLDPVIATSDCLFYAVRPAEPDD